VRYVCNRGALFVEDASKADVTYECQNGTLSGTRRGFFNTPEKEKDWDRCDYSKSFMAAPS
jgi:hypothetical protein